MVGRGGGWRGVSVGTVTPVSVYATDGSITLTSQGGQALGVSLGGRCQSQRLDTLSLAF